MVAFGVVICLMSAGMTALAEGSSAPGTAHRAVRLGYATSKVVQLAQAKLNDDTIIAYIKSCGNSYNLDADQIIYLNQQGISEAVITAMLTQPRAGVALPTTPAPPPVDSAGYPAPVSPDAAYVPAVPDATDYSTPYYYNDQPYYYYPTYVSYPPVIYYYGVGGGWGRGWHGGGYYGGGHRVAASIGGGYRGGGSSGGYRGGHIGGGVGGGHVGGGHVGGGHVGGGHIAAGHVAGGHGGGRR